MAFINGKYKEALEIAKEALALGNNNSDAHQCAANAYMSFEDYEKAIIHYQKAIYNDPENGDRYFNLGYAYASDNQQTEALASFAKADEIGCSPNVAGQLYKILGMMKIVGDACSVRVTNSINVGITQEIDQAISRKFMDGHRGYNSDGEMIVALTVEEEKDFTNLFIFNTFAKCYAEREYLRYLNQDRWLIYKTSSSKYEATRNITELNDIICKYCNVRYQLTSRLVFPNRSQ